MAGAELISNLFFFGALLLLCLALFFYWLSLRRGPVVLIRHEGNPVLSPNADHWWESQAVFNPGAVVHDGRVHLFYRAMGNDGISRIGHASSADGVHFDERSLFPVYDIGAGFTPQKNKHYAPLSYRTDLYASGGGWGGLEDARTVAIDDELYMIHAIFEGWQSIRQALTSLSLGDLSRRNWEWSQYMPISPPGEVHKNWVFFPEKINGKFAILHAVTPKIMIEYVEKLEDLRENPIKSNNNRGGRKGKWDAFIRGAGAPPLRTDEGWLLIYRAGDPETGVGYKIGAMLLDINEPTKILYQSAEPVLEPKEWYEHDWKPNIVYTSAAVIRGDDLIVYYGGGDKYVAAARANLKDFLHKLTSHEHAVLEPVKT